MIRINLLAIDQARPATPAFSGLGANKVHLLGILLLLAGVAATSWRHLDLTSRQRIADEQLEQARAEERRLKAVTEELARFEQQTTLLQQRVALIEQLRKGQRSPVTLLDQVSRGLPDRLWLTSLKQTGAEVALEGRTSTLTALSDLVGNLESSGAFSLPVEIVSSEVEENKDGDLVKFLVKANFPMGAIEAPEPSTPTSGRPAPPRPAAR